MENKNKELEYVTITNQDGVEVNVVIDDEGELACEIRDLGDEDYVIVAETDNGYSEVIGVYLGGKTSARDAINELVATAAVPQGSVSAREYLKFIGESIIGVPKSMTALEYLNEA